MSKVWPFSLTPAGMGLKGKDRDKAHAYYYLQGRELQERLCEIDFDKDSLEYKKRMVEIDLEFDVIDEREYEIRICDLTFAPGSEQHKRRMMEIHRDYDHLDNDQIEAIDLELMTDKESKEYLIRKAALDLKLGEIEQWEHDKIVATAKNEPWVGYKDHGLDEADGVKLGFFFELEWNDQFIEELKENDYDVKDPDLAVRVWYAELCRTIALEEGLALDILNDESASAAPYATTRAPTRKTVKEDGKVDYS